MIRPLRRYHAGAFAMLAVLLPGVVAAGLLARKPLAIPAAAPERITLRAPSGVELVADAREMWGAAVDLPDPLVYWTEAYGSDNMRLLGSLEAARKHGLEIPAGAHGRGWLVLYSLAQRRAAARAPAPKEMP
jgi:hypothetical protein